jgi:hypothetical protein
VRARLPVWSFLGWTLFVWVSRIRNIVADDDLSTGGMLWRLAAAVLFVALAVAVIVVERRQGQRGHVLLGFLAFWTIGWWSIRGIGIILDDRSVGFTVVHTVLMLVSIGLAMWAWQRRDG